MAVGKFRSEYPPASGKSGKAEVSAQLCICAIPAFFKLPGVYSFDLGSRTEGQSQLFAATLRSILILL